MLATHAWLPYLALRRGTSKLFFFSVSRYASPWNCFLRLRQHNTVECTFKSAARSCSHERPNLGGENWGIPRTVVALVLPCFRCDRTINSRECTNTAHSIFSAYSHGLIDYTATGCLAALRRVNSWTFVPVTFHRFEDSCSFPSFFSLIPVCRVFHDCLKS